LILFNYNFNIFLFYNAIFIFFLLS
jgi:hypothetical protein